MTSAPPAAPTRVHIVSLGCARNDVDSEELAARLADGGFALVDDPAAADAVMVNTCGFVEGAKADSINTLLEHTDDEGPGRPVVAVGCLAERYGRELAAAVPEVDVLSFDDYDNIADRLTAIVSGAHPEAHVPRDRRSLLPISPVERGAASTRDGVSIPGHARRVEVTELPDGVAPASGPRTLRRRLQRGPMAPLKIASGCDRRCSFCAIPSFRGAYVSRPRPDIVAEARWLVEQGVKEVFLVSENTTSYGKDLADLQSLEKLLGDLSSVDGLDWVRVSYLQPAELRPSLVSAICSTDKVVPYFDLSFQHASHAVLRRMRRFGDPDSFLSLLDQIRTQSPTAGIRSNVITGFPGETDADVQVLTDFLVAARLDAVGVFGYSDEDGTEAAGLDDQIDPAAIESRRAALADLVDELMTDRAAMRIGETVQVLVEEHVDGEWTGRAAHQGPEVDGTTSLVCDGPLVEGLIVDARVIDAVGVDLVARVSPGVRAGDRRG